VSWKAWTDAENDILRSMIAAGDGREQISLKLGRSQNSVTQRARMLGLKFDPEGIRRRYIEAIQTRRKYPETRKKFARPLGIKPSPEALAKRSATMKAVCAQPQYRAKLLARLEMANDSVSSAQRALAVSDARLPWCPREYRDAYRKLKKRNRLTAAEARKAIEMEIGRDLRRAFNAIAAISKPLAEEQRRQYRSFEAELARVQAGREVVEIAPWRSNFSTATVGLNAKVAANG
jgi:hypothetical protein